MAQFATMEKVSPDPAANNDLIYTADENMIVWSLAFTLVADATVGNRTMRLYADDGTDTFFSTQYTTAVTASTTTRFSAFSGSVHASSFGQTLAFPAGGMRLKVGDRIVVEKPTTSAGDNFSAMVLQIERVG